MHVLPLLQTIVFGTVTDDSARAVAGAIVEIEALNARATSAASGSILLWSRVGSDR